MKAHVLFLRNLGACKEALEWAGNFETLRQAIVACEKADWLLWLVHAYAARTVLPGEIETVIEEMCNETTNN